MDETLFQGSLKGGATIEEARVLRALARAYRDETHAKFVYTDRDANDVLFGVCRGSHDELYATTLTRCSCPGGAHGFLCTHQTALADRSGEMERLVPDFYARFELPTAMGAAA